MPISKKNKPSLETMVKNIHKKTRSQVRNYFNNRGINDESIDKYILGLIEQGDDTRYMIPVLDRDGKVAYVKLRRTPSDESTETVAKVMGSKTPIPKYEIYPLGTKPVLVGEDQLIKSTSVDVLICNGELDRIIAIQDGVKIPVVTGGCSAREFKDEWINALKNMRNIYICLKSDSDIEVLAKRISGKIPSASIYKISLPFNDAEKDLTDYFAGGYGTADELTTKYSEFYSGAKPIDVSQFKELTVKDIASILDTTIKYDYASKVITFLAMLLAYTDSDQLNIMFSASSSTGKSFICHEVSKYFPQQDVNIYGKTTPNAFYYSQKLRKKDEETGEFYIDLKRRIMVFVEQPDTQLQANLRAILSHEKPKVPFAITNKNKSGRNAAEEGYILGYPSAFFCSATAAIDEQEQTRSIVLSPDSSRQKVLAGIDAYIEKNCDKNAFDTKLQGDEGRNMLMERILYIKSLKVGTIDVSDRKYLRQRFVDSLNDNFPPGAMRGIHKFTALAKAMALINAPFRTVDGKIMMINKDVDEAMKLWEIISGSMAYGLSPQLFSFYKDVILPAWYRKKNNNPRSKGVTLKELRMEYYRQIGSLPNMENMRKKWILELETSDFIECEKSDEGDKREKLIIPQNFFDGVEEKA